jgi:hypothetical protein
MTKLKILFLDIDGPMIPQRAYLLPENFRKICRRFDPIAVAMINHLTDRGVKVVLSSTWRKEFDSCSFRAIMSANGMNCSSLFHPDWRTGDVNDRRQEIAMWITEHLDDIDRFAILDDESVGLPYLVQVSGRNGISWLDFESLCDYLGVDKMSRT